jgi:WhiB family redox-sensing transcriptional regulator
VSHPDWHWQDEAACFDSGINFFPSRGDETETAKAMCKTCPVREECLEYALGLNIRFGVWGGKSERQRKRMRAERGRSVSEYQRDFILPVAGANHGTRWAYEGLGCRCDECVAAQREKGRVERQRRAERERKAS